MRSGDQTSVATAIGHQSAASRTGIGGQERLTQTSIGRPVTHFISCRAFLYQRHIPQSDPRFGLSETAPSQKTLVFFGLCR
ncbi:hypothetical protein EB230_21740 [Mesorhizobium sp. NZP2234]|nr:hypothetical protein EB230_21740 [Mesorhizobium sp. NZP2234]